MLSLTFALLAHLSAPSAVPGAVVAYHGTRTEYVFTRPIVIKAHVDACAAYDALWSESCVQRTDGSEEFDCSVPDATILAAFKACQATRETCEWVGPRLDGTTVKVCGGSVVAVALGSDVRTVRQ